MQTRINRKKYTFCVIKSLEQQKNLKNGPVPYLSLELPIHVIKSQIHLMIRYRVLWPHLFMFLFDTETRFRTVSLHMFDDKIAFLNVFWVIFRFMLIAGHHFQPLYVLISERWLIRN
jgi:hypothetical protein